MQLVVFHILSHYYCFILVFLYYYCELTLAFLFIHEVNWTVTVILLLYRIITDCTHHRLFFSCHLHLTSLLPSMVNSYIITALMTVNINHLQSNGEWLECVACECVMFSLAFAQAFKALDLHPSNDQGHFHSPFRPVSHIFNKYVTVYACCLTHINNHLGPILTHTDCF